VDILSPIRLNKEEINLQILINNKTFKKITLENNTQRTKWQKKKS